MYNLTEPAELVSNIVYMIQLYCMHYIDTLFQDEIEMRRAIRGITLSVSVPLFTYISRPRTLISILVSVFMFIILIYYYHGLQVQNVLVFMNA